MPEATGQPAKAVAGGGAAAKPDVKRLWPVPALLVAGALLAAGLVVAGKRAPKADPMAPLERAREASAAGEFEEAIGIVNKEMLPAIGAGKLSEAEQGQVLLTRARALAGGQAKLNLNHPDNHRAILDDYKAAQGLGIELAPSDTAEMSLSQLALGEVAKAIEIAQTLPDSETARRIGLYKRIVEANLGSKDMRVEQTLGLLTELLSSTTLGVDDRAWATARQTELRLAMGYEEEAITQLLRAIPMLEGMSDSHRGELLFLLGRAYLALGQFAGAAKHFDAAEAALPEHDALRGDVLVHAGRVLQAGARLDAARERFQEVRAAYANTPAVAPALLGLAEIAAAEHADDLAVGLYDELWAAMRATEGRRGRVAWEEIGLSLYERYAAREVAGEMGAALRYARMAEQAYRAGTADPPAEVLLAVGRTSRAIAQAMLDEARETEGGRLATDQISPVTQAEAKRHLLEAGVSFNAHAARVLESDVGAYRESIWSAAECFDLGGDSQNAMVGFMRYLQDTPADDPRHNAARFRYAQVLEAEGNFVGAAAEYLQLVEARDASRGAGPVGDQSIVPLARCYLRDEDASNDAAAEQLLEQAIGGASLQPEAAVYREALLELGGYLHGAGRYTAAITRLEEAAARYPEDPRVSVVAYKLGDSCRLQAVEIEKALREAMPQARREDLERLRHQRLEQATGWYQRTIDGVDGKDRRRVTPLEQLARRNSAFYLGDCAFEMKDYGRAIEHYDVARQRYAEDPASLVAMVQIVNCYVAQKKWAEALTANDRARQQLASIPRAAWDSPDIPMGREHWERWLDSATLLEEQKRSRASAEGSGQE